MTDIERELRDLGDRTRDEQSRRVVLNPRTCTRIKLRRLGTVMTGLIVVAALALGGTFAAGAFTSGTSKIGPAQASPSPEFSASLYAMFDGERVELAFQPEGGMICYFGALMTADDRVERSEIVEGQEERTSVIVLEPNPNEISVDTGDNSIGWCVKGVDGQVMNAILESPDRYFLVLEFRDGTDAISPLRSEGEENRSKPCGPPVDFEPTYLPDGWVKALQPGSGGGAAWTTVGHYGNEAVAGTTQKARAGFADLVAGESPYPLRGGDKIRVLDEPALVAEIHEGYSVEFTQHDCDYALLGWGMSLQELRRFAEGLRLPGEFVAPEAEHFGAIWPEDTFQQAQEACVAAADDSDSPRHSPILMAIVFTREVLDWNPAETLSEHTGDGGQRIRVRRGNADDPPEPDGPAVVVVVNEVLPDCWSVHSVQRTDEESQRYSEDQGASLGVTGREVNMYFADFRDASTATLEVGYGGQVTRHEWRRGDEFAEWRLDFEPRGKGHFLVLLRDENGAVFSAFGSPLPEGDFAAG